MRSGSAHRLQPAVTPGERVSLSAGVDRQRAGLGARFVWPATGASISAAPAAPRPPGFCGRSRASWCSSQPRVSRGPWPRSRRLSLRVSAQPGRDLRGPGSCGPESSASATQPVTLLAGPGAVVGGARLGLGVEVQRGSPRSRPVMTCGHVPAHWPSPIERDARGVSCGRLPRVMAMAFLVEVDPRPGASPIARHPSGSDPHRAARA